MKNSFRKTTVGDCFNEDISELQFLHSKPTCFIIIGKPGCGRTSLAKKLSELWHCQHLLGVKVVEEEIAKKSEIGISMQEILFKGEALSTDFMILLLKEKLCSAEVAHYGYVLDELPALSEESSSVQAQIDMIKGCQLKPDFIINVKIPDIDLHSRKIGLRVDHLTGTMYSKNEWNISETAVEKPQQEESEELADEEEGEETSDQPLLKKPVQLDKEVKERLVHLPEHQAMATEETSRIYKEVSLKLLEDYMSDHDRQCVIEVDGNCPLDILVEKLMLKLDTYTLRRAVVPYRFKEETEEDAPEDYDSEELLRSLGSYNMPGPRYRWRPSKWGKWCPVALSKGNMLQGKSEFAVSFMDKIYLLSSAEAVTEFLKNPRPFLLPPQPVIPCKLAVIGPMLSGKSSISAALSNRYKAVVFNLKEMMAPKLAEETERIIEKTIKDTTEHAIPVVQAKVEQEHMLFLASEKFQKGPAVAELSDSAEEAVTENEIFSIDSSEKPGPPVVTEDHEEVRRMVSDAVAEVKRLPVKLPAEVYIDALKASIAEMVETRKAAYPDAPINGGWILDGFPENKDQWAALVASDIVPDEYIVLTDRSQNMEFIRKRYFELHQTEIVEKYRSRLLSEKQAVLKDVEIELARIMEERVEEEALKMAEEQKAKEQQPEGDENEEDEQQPEGFKKQESAEELEEGKAKSGSTTDAEEGEKPIESRPRLTSIRYQEESEKQAKLFAEIREIQEADFGMPPLDAPEFNQFKDILRNHDKEFNFMVGSIASAGGKLDYSEVQDLPPDVIGKEIGDEIDASFGFQAAEFSVTDADEEEDDFNAEVELGMVPEAEDEDAVKEKKKHFGYTKNYDPIALKEDFVLFPGSSEIAAKYRERTYYFASIENRDKFLDNPVDYLPQDEPINPPPVRVLFLGSKGAGKSLQARKLAKKLGIFHISFRDRLQELILHKVKHKVGPEHEDAKLLRQELSVSVEEAVQKATAEEAVDVKDEDEEPDYQFNDEEDAIYTSLVDDDPLPVELLEKILMPFWKEEPYRSTGFILEGFPRTGDEAQFLMQNGLYPDIALSFMIDEADAINRILPSRLELWKQRREVRLLKREKTKERRKEIRTEKIDLRRAELLNEQMERKMEALKSGEEEEEEEDIEEILQAEFEEEEEEEDVDEEEETEDDAADRMKTELADAYETEMTKLQVVQDQLEEGLLPFVEIPAKRKPSIITYLINKQLRSYMEHRSNLLEQVHPITMELANKLLLSGYKHPSTFMKWDPVQVHEGAVMPPLISVEKPAYPVVFHHYVYFLSSLDSRDKFMRNPLQYAFNYVHNRPVVPLQIAVVGPPKSGKTTLCERFSRDYGTVRVSVGGCVRKVLETQPDTHLATEIQAHLMKGEVVPDELAVEALAVVLLDTVCTSKGYTLDGYPCTGNQMVLMNKRGILPVRIIELQIDAREMLNRADKVVYPPSPLPWHSSDDILAVRYSCYCEHTAPLQVYYKKQHDNWTVVDAKISKWKLWETSLKLAMRSIAKVQAYLIHTAKGFAAPIADLCVTPKEYEKHLGVYAHYCPVCLNLNGELTDCSDNFYMQFAVEYKAKYYKTCGKDHMDIFINSSDVFVPPVATKELPSEDFLPKRRSREEAKALFPMPVLFMGFCPVAYAERNCRFEGLVEGNPELAVQYREGLFYFSDETNLKAFMKSPETYYGLQLPNKLPPKKKPMNINLLPMLGYMEQGVASSIIRALTEVGCLKPKFPFISVRRTSLFFIACHLKAFNPQYSNYLRKKYLNKLQDFKNVCEVVPYLGDHMTRNCPIKSSLEFDANMRLFLGHENLRPTRDWVM